MFTGVLFSLAIITLRKKERCVCLCLFATVQGIGLQSVLLTLSGHTHFEQILQLVAISQLTTSQFPGIMLIQYMYLMMINTRYHNSNLIWRTVSRRVDEVIPSDHLRRVASRVIQWYGLIHET